jgi:hypothetical protein
MSTSADESTMPKMQFIVPKKKKKTRSVDCQEKLSIIFGLSILDPNFSEIPFVLEMWAKEET